MKILIYTHAFAPMIGGIETYTMQLARGIAELARTGTERMEVTVGTQAQANGMDDSVLPFQVVRKPGPAQLARLVWRADVIHVANPAMLPMLLAWLFRKPVVVEHDGHQSACPNGMFFHEPTQTSCPGHFLARRYKECLRCNRGSYGKWGSLRLLLLTFPRRWLCSRMTLHIGPSKHVARRIEIPGTQIVYHGLACSSAATEVSTSPVGSTVCFAYVGRMVQEKGVPVLLRAAHRLRKRGYDFRLKLIGDGPVLADLQRMTDELGLRTRTVFTGFLQGKALHDAMSEVTAAVMPSICEDVAPLASIEHMMNGRLVIASDLGGLGELVDGVGLKFPPGDDEALANCLRHVLEQPGLMRDLGNSAIERARSLFTQDRMVKDHLKIYAQIIPVESSKNTKTNGNGNPTRFNRAGSRTWFIAVLKSSYRVAVRTLSRALPDTILFRSVVLLRKFGLGLKRAGVPPRLQKAVDFLFYNLCHMRPAIVETQLRGHRFFIQLNDPCQYDLLLGIHEPRVEQWIKSNLEDGMIFFDIGANIGYYTLLGARCVGRSGRVVALEPNPTVAAILRRNTEINSLKNVEIVQGAASRACGNVKLGRAGSSSYASGLYCESPIDWIEVRGYSLDALASELQIPAVDLVKLDVEGAEVETIEGMTKILDVDRPKVLMELHSHFGTADSHPAVQKLKNAGYSIRSISENHVIADPTII